MKEFIGNYLAGELEPEQIEKLRDWIYENETNRKYFAKSKAAWIAAGNSLQTVKADVKTEYKLLQTRIAINDLPDIDQKQASSLRINPGLSRFIWRAAAILILLTAAGGVFFMGRAPRSGNYNELVTQRGEKTSLTLHDGTKIWLNSGTTLRYPSDLNQRNVNVYLDGEAFFEVTKKHGRTFTVQAGTLEIAVLGTSFNVKSYGEEGLIETTLEKGSISITGELAGKKITKPVLLSPNQQAIFKKGSAEYRLNDMNQQSTVPGPAEQELIPTEAIRVKPGITLDDQVDTKLYSGWKDGKLIFKSENFGDLAIRMERWYDVKIEIMDDELRSKKYTGVFEKETIEQALKALSLSLPFYYEIDQNRIRIKKL